MEVTRKINARTTVKVDGEKVTDVFAKLSMVDEGLGEKECGKCGCEDLAFKVRDVEGNKFYELWCRNLNCRYRLSFGQPKNGSGAIFPRRQYHKQHPDVTAKKARAGDWLPSNGWQPPYKNVEEDSE